MSFWQTFILIVEIFFFFAYLMVLFQIITDLFRDKELGGVAKAIWMVTLILIPLLTAIVYLIARGRGMAERQIATVVDHQKRTHEYIREVAGTNPAQEIAQAKALLDSGTITAQEFESIKAHALAGK